MFSLKEYMFCESVDDVIIYVVWYYVVAITITDYCKLVICFIMELKFLILALLKGLCYKYVNSRSFYVIFQPHDSSL